MPIRFRCAHCNQLMGIARRKAGTVVRCPKCAGQVVVPAPTSIDDDDVEHAPATAAKPAEGGPFEYSDFEKILGDGPQLLNPPTLPNPPSAVHRPGIPDPALMEYEAVPLGPLKNSARGIFLTSGVLAVVSALVVVLMGMAFFLGLLLGRSAGP